MALRDRFPFWFPIRKFDDPVGLHKNFRYLEDFMKMLHDSGDGGQFTLSVAANDALQSSKNGADYVCDGTDDHVQIQAAVDELWGGSGSPTQGRIVLSEGNFDVDPGEIDFSAHANEFIWLMGMGYNHTFITTTATAGIVVEVGNKTIISDVSIGGPSTAGTLQGVGGTGGNVTIRNVWFPLMAQGIQVDGHQWFITESVFSTIGGDAVATGGVTDLRLTNNMLLGGAINLDNITDAFIDGNQLAVDIYGSPIDHVLIANNTFLSAAADNTHRIELDDTLQSPTRITIVGNTMENASFGGVRLDGVTDGLVSGNFLEGTGAPSGISLESCSNISVTDNDVGGYVGGHGISLTDTSDSLIAENLIVEPSQDTTNTYDGIILSGNSDRNTIANNKITAKTTVPQPRYAINVSAATCNDNRIHSNDTGVAGDYATAEFNDAGTGTMWGPEAGNWLLGEESTRTTNHLVQWDGTDFVLGATAAGTVDHTDLTTIGVNTHAQLDLDTDFFNGTLVQSPTVTIAEAGGVVTMSLTGPGTSDLTLRFSDGHTIFDATPAATIALTVGSDDASPQGNYIYILKSTKALTKSTSDWPSAEHIKIAFFECPTAAFVSSNGVYSMHIWGDGRENSTGQGHMSHITERQRRMGARWFSGVSGAGGNDYITRGAGTTDFKSTAGVVYQLHRHTFDAFDTSGGDVVLVKNWNGDSWHDITDLYDITADSGGNPITNNKWFNLVFWGIANESGTYQPIVCNLPSGFYHTQSAAEQDDDVRDDFTMPTTFSNISSTGFLIARVTLQMKTGGGTWGFGSTVDLRGFSPITAKGGAASTITEFPDSTFNIHDEADESRELTFSVGGIAAATTRVVTAQDADGTMEFTGHAHADLESTETLALQGDITPTILSADQNNYNPTGLADATIVRLEASGADKTITGLAGGADGRVIILMNIGTTYNIFLIHESASSSAANRFDNPLALNNSIVPRGMIALIYDSTTSRWRRGSPAEHGNEVHFPDFSATDHTIVSHDTTGTGTQLTELTDASETALHSHAGSSLTTKGDLHGYDTGDARVPIGTNTHVLTADSTQGVGLKWAAAPGSASQYEFPHDFYIRPDGSDSNDGLSWDNAWQTLLKAETGVSSADFARIHLSEGDHLINGAIPTFKDGIHILGPYPISADRATTSAGASARITRTAAGNISHYVEFLTTAFDNVYGVSVQNVHFNVEKIDNYAIYAENANNGEVSGCAMTKDNDFFGAWHDKPMIRITGPSETGNDMSWWWIYNNFVEHCRLVYADADNGWLNGIQVGPNNIGITSDASGERATTPYVHLKGRGGRNAVFNNMFEVGDSTNGLIFLENMYQTHVYGNGFERLIGSNRAICLKSTTSSVVSHAAGETSGYNGRVYEWDEVAAAYDLVPAGFTESGDMGSGHTTTGNIYTIATEKTLL
jgi:hypothetical protein